MSEVGQLPGIIIPGRADFVGMDVRKSMRSGAASDLLAWLLVFLCAVSPVWAQDSRVGSTKTAEMGVDSTSRGYTVDGFRHYITVDDLKGTITCSGSRGYDKVLPDWMEAFRSLYPGVEFKINLTGSGAAVGAILKSEAKIGLMSRSIKNSEIKGLTEGLGHKPSWIPVLVDVVAIIVNKKNPVPGLSLKQLDAIFSKSLKRGADRSIDRWEQLGVGGDLGKHKINLYTRLIKTTAYEFFVEEVLLNGEMKPDSKECSSAADMFKQVEQDIAAIGFSGLDGITDNVRTVALGIKETEFFTPKWVNIRKGVYPLTREFIMVFDRKPGQDTEQLTFEFLKFVLSLEGYAVAAERAFFPVPVEEMRKAYSVIE